MNETELRISLSIERWDHIGDEHSPMGWVKDGIIRLTMAPAAEALRYVRELQAMNSEPIEKES